MRVRYQFMKYPETGIYETPEQAYLIIKGSSQLFETRKLQKRKRTDSLNCNHRCHHSKSQKSQSKQCVHIRDQEPRTRTGLQSGHMRSRLKSVNGCKEYKEYGNVRATHNTGAFSFRDLNTPEPRMTISCNYDKYLEEENNCLRKQNKFLQEYIHTLQQKTRKQKDRHRDLARHSPKQSQNSKQKDRQRQKQQRTRLSRYESTKNSFIKRNVDSSDKNSDDEGSTFAQRTFSSKGEGQYNFYRN